MVSGAGIGTYLLQGPADADAHEIVVGILGTDDLHILFGTRFGVRCFGEKVDPQYGGLSVDYSVDDGNTAMGFSDAAHSIAFLMTSVSGRMPNQCSKDLAP